MKRPVFLIIGVLLVTSILSVGCGTKATPAPAALTQNITGILKDINTPSEPGKDVVAIETPQGLRAIAVTENTTFTLEGKTCLLDDIGKVLDEGKTKLVCTVVVTVPDPYHSEEAAIAVYVKQQ